MTNPSSERLRGHEHLASLNRRSVLRWQHVAWRRIAASEQAQRFASPMPPFDGWAADTKTLGRPRYATCSRSRADAAQVWGIRFHTPSRALHTRGVGRAIGVGERATRWQGVDEAAGPLPDRMAVSGSRETPTWRAGYGCFVARAQGNAYGLRQRRRTDGAERHSARRDGFSERAG